MEMRRERPRDRLWKKAFCFLEIECWCGLRCAETTLTLTFVANLFSMRAFAKENFHVRKKDNGQLTAVITLKAPKDQDDR
jgi:hypothetical protein